MFETKTPVEEREKKGYKQTQTTKQQDGKRNQIQNKRKKLKSKCQNKITMKQTLKQANEQTKQQAKKETDKQTNKQTERKTRNTKNDITNRQENPKVRGCLQDTGATFAPERVHSGSLSWLYICLHDTTTKCYAGASHPGVSSPRFSHRGENFTPVRSLATVSCKRETTTHFGVKSVCR